MSFSSNIYREFIGEDTGGSLFFYCIHEISVDNDSYTMYTRYCQTGGDLEMRYLKFVVGNNEVARSLKNSEDMPVVGTVHYNGYDIEISECSYKEKYRIWRRRKCWLSDVVSRFIKEGKYESTNRYQRREA